MTDRSMWAAESGEEVSMDVVSLTQGIGMPGGTNTSVACRPGTMIGCGLVVGLAAALTGFGYARWADRHWPLVTAVIRVAQGSATVAMITAAGVIAPIVAEARPGYHPVSVAVAIGCGSKIGLWMNDNGFWVISRLSGMPEGQTLRSASVMMLMLIEGTAGLLATLAMAAVWPLR